MQQKENSEAFEWLDTFGFALTFIFLVLIFCVSSSQVFGASMDTTLHEGDRVLVQSLFYVPQRGDVVTTDAWIDYGKPLVKRVIAVGGDVVDIRPDGKVYVNDELQEEPYIGNQITQPGDWVYPITVPQGKVFLMGDNRGGSSDSRNTIIGLIDVNDILGKVLARVTPWANKGWIA